MASTTMGLGKQLRLEIRATSGEANPEDDVCRGRLVPAAGHRGRSTVMIPLQLVDDQKYRATFPGLIVNGGPAETGLDDFHSNQARLPENNYAGRNRSRYVNPELDALIDHYLTTIPFDARMDTAREITRHLTENLPALPLFFDSWPSATLPG